MHDNIIAFSASTKAAAGSAIKAASETQATVVRFSSPEKLRRAQAVMRRISEKQHMAALAGSVSTDISLNESLRRDRDGAWDRADASVRFLRAQLEYYRAVAIGRKYGVPDARGLPALDAAADFQLVEACRMAELEKILTPAPRVAALTWKRRKVAALGPYDWVGGVTLACVEKAIADDEAFFEAFPARHSPNRPKGVKAT